MTAEEHKKSEKSAPQEAPPGAQAVAVRLIPANDSDLPVVCNFTRVQLSPAGALIDFGFLEPAGLALLARTARTGGKMPDAVNGRLAARFALTPDALTVLHQQLGQALSSNRSADRQKPSREV